MPHAEHDLQGRISELWIYPIKSCAGVRLERSRLFAHGLEWDRQWMVVDGQGEFLTQRGHPRMALIRPRITQSHLVLEFPGLPDLRLPLRPQESQQPPQPCRVRVWRDWVQAWELGEQAAEAAQWLGEALRTPCRLVRFDNEQPRAASAQWAGDDDAPVHFADGFPLLLLSQSAVDGLNQRLAAAGEPGVDARRFRPNILITGLDAHGEDRVRRFELPQLPGLALRPCKPCTRCPIPDIDPDTAVPGKAVGAAMRAYRRDARVGGALTFGMNAVVCGLPAQPQAWVELSAGQLLEGCLQPA